MPELLDQIRSQLSVRIEELRPLVDEQRRLEAALQALGSATSKRPATASVSPSAPAKTRTRTSTPATPRKRAPRGANREAVLAAVRERPGATSAELAAASGVAQNTVNGLLARLAKQGELQTRALPTGRKGYVLAPTKPEGPATPATLDGESPAVEEPPAPPASPTI